ncbi:MAG: FMN-binding protein [Eubacterium sp.]|nr:FMN-binding protein [Eubacterium sp.]
MKMKRLIVLLMTATMILSGLAVTTFAEDAPAAQGKTVIAGTVIPFGLYEPTETELYDSGRVKVLCNRVHVAHTVTAEITFTSTNYTEAKIGEATYAPYLDEAAGTVTFMLPVEINEPLKFSAHTTSMGGKDIDYEVTVKLDKDNLKPAARGALQDGFYTTTINTNKAAYGWKLDKNNNLQEGFSYPSKDYDFPVTVEVKDGKIADVAYTIDTYEIIANSGSDINYLMWAMDGHNVTDDCYESKTLDGSETYHIDPAPAKNGKGMAEQFIGKTDIAGIDTVSAATLTSRAIINAVDQNLTKAERGQKDDPAPELPQPDTTPDVVPADGYYYAKGDCIGADLDDEKDILLHVADGKITIDALYIQQRKKTYPHIFFGSEADALAAGESGWLNPEEYDYGYKYLGTKYSNITIKSLDKPQLFVMLASSSNAWFNRPITISSASLRPATEASAGLSTAEEELEAVLVKEGATPEEIAAAKTKVSEAADAVANAAAAKASTYTKGSVDAVAAAAAAYKEAVAKEDAAAADIKAAKAALDEAVAGLTAKQAQKLSVKAVKKTLKAKALKKKAASYKAVKVSGNKGKVSYTAKASGKSKKVLKFKAGKITVKKGTKKGTYKMTVTVKAAANDNFKAASKKVTVSVKVK